MQVRGYRLLVIPDPIEEQTEGGIILTVDKDKAKIAQMYGTVYQVGSECWKGDDPWCQPGDRICWSKFAGKFVRDENDKEYVILNDEDVLCTLESIKDE